MGRSCQICFHGLSQLVRDESAKGKTPGVIAKIIFDKVGVVIKYHQYRWHQEHHDPYAGTVTRTKKEVDKKLEEAESKVVMADRIFHNSIKFADKIVGFGEKIQAANFDSMSPEKQIQTVNQTIGTMLKMIQTDVAVQKASLEIDLNLRKANNTVAKLFKTKGS